MSVPQAFTLVEPMTKEDQKIQESVHRRAFARAMRKRVEKELKRSNDQLPFTSAVQLSLSLFDKLDYHRSRSHQFDAMLMYSRQVLVSPMEQVSDKVFKGMKNQEVQEIMALFEEYCSRSEFPTLGTAQQVDLSLHLNRFLKKE